MLTEPDILAALRDCFDPELKLNLVDLGLIYKIEMSPDPDSTPRWPRQLVDVILTAQWMGSEAEAGLQRITC